MADRVARILNSYVTFLLVGVVVGAAVAPVALQAAALPDGTVAVVPIEGSIDGETANQVSAMLEQARQDPDVKAVVLVVNSGGGTAAGSEAMYLQVKRTARQMPVVASIDAIAASGAYYAVLPSEHIYAVPSSAVGSVGVLAPNPSPAEPNDLITATGPNKLSGVDDREHKYNLERLQEAFLGAVMANRGDELTIERRTIAQARIWVGIEAAQNGLVDEIGGRQAAIQRAARKAGLDDYRVKVLRPQNASYQFVSRSAYLASTAADKRMISPWHYAGEGQNTVYLMMPASFFEAEADEEGEVVPRGSH